jgi:hypothetical protein
VDGDDIDFSASHVNISVFPYFFADKVTLFLQLLFEVVPTTAVNGIGNMYD